MPPKSRKYCCICSNFRGKLVDEKVISLYRFPVNKRVRRAWLQRCQLMRSDFKLTKNTFLCSDHFADREGQSPMHVIPSVFPSKTFKTSKLDENFDFMEKIPDLTNTVETDIYCDNLQQNYSEDNLGNNDVEERSFMSSESMLDNSLKLHDYVPLTYIPQSKGIRNQFVQTLTERRTFCTQTDYAAPCLVDTAMQTDKSTRDIAVQVCLPQLTYDDICSDDSKVFFYTGIPNKNTFDALFDELKDDAAARTARKTSSEEVSCGGRPRTLRLVDEFFLVLMRLRLGLLLLIEDLAQRFCISTTTCGDIFNRWTDYLDNQLSFLIQWTERKCIDENMPDVFRRKFPSTRVVIDCTEIKTETPSSLQLKSLLYSDYKSHMPWKSLVGISPVGVITFISDLWCGSISDKQITKECGILDLCEPGDGIMADKGFTIADLTTPLGVHLVIPPFRGKKVQFSKREVQKTRDIANARIHVERQMARIKNFRILQGVMPITMSQNISKIWKLCARLTNLQPPLVLDNKDVQS